MGLGTRTPGSVLRSFAVPCLGFPAWRLAGLSCVAVWEDAGNGAAAGPPSCTAGTSSHHGNMLGLVLQMLAQGWSCSARLALCGRSRGGLGGAGGRGGRGVAGETVEDFAGGGSSMTRRIGEGGVGVRMGWGEDGEGDAA